MPPSEINRAIPPELDKIISKALEKERALRYQHAAEMREALARLKRHSEKESGGRACFGRSQPGWGAAVPPSHKTTPTRAALGGDQRVDTLPVQRWFVPVDAQSQACHSYP